MRPVSLRVKLTVAVVLLVTLAAAVISVISVIVLRDRLFGRVDDQIRRTTETLRRDMRDERPAPDGRLRVYVPSDVLVLRLGADGAVVARSRNVDPRLEAALPKPVPEGGFTVGGWRVLSGDGLVVAMPLAGIEETVGQVAWLDALVALAVVAVVAAAGALVVRGSLRPLTEIEETAGIIAAGDLSRRVEESEPGEGVPRTEVGRLARSLNGMLAQIETAFRARTASEARMRQFVSDAGHELRTPLTTIRGFADLYRRQHGDHELVARIAGAAERMGLLVEDLLLLASLDQSRPLRRDRVDLLAVTAEVVRETALLARDRTIDLVVAGENAPHVIGDGSGLRQVVANLLGNAVRHTPPGTAVEVRLVEGRLRDGGPAVVLEVADHGPGLRPEQAERVFERFYRADRARSRDEGGTGLGLAIVAGLAAAHGGTAEVETAPGRGATFRVRIPAAD
ncbi:two-component system OmpR family sensor kinase [Thermocatellispora tengchongensis]|uniref:histidine kinase n=1 Tax=Thermocatellispora tengchongensis TaxID=1073253 RepID=A0A840P4F7_9ACTN|nr:HAMP domain-containing sensor histidine kinase [Thermocatellispora tengchongensis]MBB5132117.1 two-component system OmpR family sensor kinase [Thermocatellispora tengchongensis]